MELQVSGEDSYHGLYYPVYYFYIPNGFTSYKGKALFSGDDAGTGLWVTDGTAVGTSELQVSGASSGGLNPFGSMPYNGKVLFEGIDANNSEGLWVTDGTATGIQSYRSAPKTANSASMRLLTTTISVRLHAVQRLRGLQRQAAVRGREC